MITMPPVTDLIYCIVTGILIGGAYEYLQWLSIKSLPSVTHKGWWLFWTTAARLFLLLFTAIVVAQDQAVRFLIIIFAFLVTRWIIVNFAKNIKGKA